MVVVLDNIRSAHNVGSIFRTADAAGVEKIYLCGVTPAPIDKWQQPDKRIAKVALGAEQILPWQQIKQTWRCIEQLKEEGYYVVALEQHKKSRSIFTKKKLPKKVALLLGQEVKGLSSSLLNRVDEIVEIPMHGQKESLNVSVAFGIGAYAVAFNIFS